MKKSKFNRLFIICVWCPKKGAFRSEKMPFGFTHLGQLYENRAERGEVRQSLLTNCYECIKINARYISLARGA